MTKFKISRLGFCLPAICLPAGTFHASKKVFASRLLPFIGDRLWQAGISFGICLPAIADNQDMISRIRLKLNNEIRL